MNAFEKLRQTIDKVGITYNFPEKEQPISHQSYRQTNPQLTQPSNTNNINSTSNDHNNHLYLKQLWQDKQTQYLRQINRLTNCVEKLTKALKISQIRNQELIKEVCSLEKNHQGLLGQIGNYNGKSSASQDQQRMYKEEILRINSTVEQMGLDLNHERHTKKTTINQLNNLKQTLSQQEKDWGKNKSQMQAKISSLKEESIERSKILEFNIKQNSQDRLQGRGQLQRTKKQHEILVSSLRSQIDQIRKLYFQTMSDLKLEQQRQNTIIEKNNTLLKEVQSLKVRLRQLETENSKSGKYIIQLQAEVKEQKDSIGQLEGEIIFEKSNIKIKVVQVRDQTVEMQLEMYKKQYRQLLQQKAILQSIQNFEEFGGRGNITMEPQYEIISKEERSQRSYQQQQIRQQPSKEQPQNKASYQTK